MPKFQIWAETGRAEPNSREELNRFFAYISELATAVEADDRVSESRTVRGPELTVFSWFVVSAEDEALAESNGRDAFEGALMPERVDRLTIQLRRGPIVIS